MPAPGASRLVVSIVKGVDPRTKRDYPELRRKVLAAFSYACFFCGFKSQHFQEIYELEPKKWAVICPFCLGLMDVRRTAKLRNGKFICLPEISQASLNALVHAAFVQMGDNGDPKSHEHGKEVLMRFEQRASEQARNLAEMGGLEDPKLLVTLLEQMPAALYAQRASPKLHFHKIRFLPNRESFAPMVKIWQKAIYHPFKPNAWNTLSKQHFGDAA